MKAKELESSLEGSSANKTVFLDNFRFVKKGFR